MIEFTHRPIDRWPQEPTRNRRRSVFRARYDQTLRLLEKELALVGVRRCYLQLDVMEYEIRNDGQVRANAKPRSPRVIVSAQSQHGPLMLPCDTFDDWQDNLRAIALSLQALRAVNRYGVTKRGEQYRGLKAITAGDGPVNSEEAARLISRHTTQPPSAILSVREVFERAYRDATKKLHPDVAGESTRHDWDNLQRACGILRDHFDSKGIN